MQYAAFIKETFGEEAALLEANPPFAFQTPDCPSFDDSKELWQGMYPNEPFYLADLTEDSTSKAATKLLDDGRAENAGLLSGFDLLASAERQATFLWRVSGEGFYDNRFLAEGVENYVRFLELMPKALEEKIVLVPTYQIDLIWQTHILSSISEYNRDCIAIMGSTLHHDDSLTDRGDGGVLDVSFNATVGLWKKAYGTEYAVHGGMYRSEPPASFFSKDWEPPQPLAKNVQTGQAGQPLAPGLKENVQTSQVGAGSKVRHVPADQPEEADSNYCLWCLCCCLLRCFCPVLGV